MSKYAEFKYWILTGTLVGGYWAGYYWWLTVPVWAWDGWWWWWWLVCNSIQIIIFIQRDGARMAASSSLTAHSSSWTLDLTWRDAQDLNIPLSSHRPRLTGSCETRQLHDYRAPPVIIGPALIINTKTQCGAIYTVVLSLRRRIEKFSKHLEDH